LEQRIERFIAEGGPEPDFGNAASSANSTQR
jgi:hypothetical protein